jgi:hypothetical protein
MGGDDITTGGCRGGSPNSESHSRRAEALKAVHEDRREKIQPRWTAAGSMDACF